MTTSRTVTRGEVEAAVNEVAARYMATGHYTALEDINAGDCGGFASDVVTLVSRDDRLSIAGLDTCWVSDFLAIMEGDEFVDDGNPFDRALVERYWPTVCPPEGFDWDDMDALSAAAGFCGGTHVFLHCEGRFYDAESSQGVSTFFDLPFFERVIAGWVAERDAVPVRAFSP